MPDYTVTTTRYLGFADQNLTTLQSYILAEEDDHGGTGDFSWIISGISLAGRAIANKVRRARIDDVIGGLDSSNVHGEEQQKLDIIANEFIMRCLGDRADIGVLASEEGETPTIIRSPKEGGKYCVAFDPLDGSSNIDVSVGVGTIFSILKSDHEDFDDAEQLILQPGTKQVAAGYILYGSSVIFVLTTGHGVDMFVLDPAIGTFVQVASKLKMPDEKKIYSINEAYYDKFPAEYQNYLQWAHKNDYSARYIGSMVADVHRTLVKGGVFIYPPTGVHRKGKLRLMYEANPMGFIMEQAGGLAYADTDRIMDIEPEALHQRCSVIMGSKGEVENVLRFLRNGGES
ncbi:MAG: class 1 fructose-bisphosphatase [Phycisphaerales bacterium]|nr:class 1 fructose-bisphosphatase [Phycisphaerales bacterium]